MNHKTADIADEKHGVAAIYEQGSIAKSYLDKRMQFSWQRLLHRKQVAVMRSVIARHRPANVLEVAPGPARLSTELPDIKKGVMVENSAEMVAIAQQRLREHSLSDAWDVRIGDAFALSSTLAPASFDLAYTFRFLRHFRTAERTHLYEQLRGCLMPGGLLVFDVVGSAVLARVQARNKERAAGEIAIYDVAYSKSEFEREMRDNGFSVIEMVPVLRHFHLQSLISYKGDDVAPRLVDSLVRLLEAVPSREPLEWVAVCRKD
jgi:ubiquinone/menaquinone biosynthesis C-methylase UbiE